jgi:anti-anti-sigma factor
VAEELPPGGAKAAPGGERVEWHAGGAASHRRVSVLGELDLRTAPGLAEALDRLLDGGVRDLELDLSAVTFMDSAGLGVLLRVHRRLQGTGRLTLTGPPPAVRRVLALSGIDDLVAVRDGAEGASGG